MTKYTTFITIGNRENDLRDYMVKQYGITPDEAQSIVAAEWPPAERTHEGHYKAVSRMVARAKWYAARRETSST
jgi:hypothetical protein